MANNTSVYDIDSDGDSDCNDVIINQFGNPLYDNFDCCLDLTDNDNTERNSEVSSNSIVYAMNSDVIDSCVAVKQNADTRRMDCVSKVTPKPMERTSLRRAKNSNADIIYTNVSKVCDNQVINKCDTSHSQQNVLTTTEPQNNDLPNLIIELESILTKMSTDEFYATPIPDNQLRQRPPQNWRPKPRPRRSLSTNSSTSTSTSSLGTRPLPQPPKELPPPKPPHLPPEIPPPPPPSSSPPPEVPPRYPIREQILRDNVDLEDQVIFPARKLSEPFLTQKITIVNPNYCQHSSCKLKGIARSQTFRSTERPKKTLKPKILNSNQEKGIIQKCGYLWKTGSNRREFLDRWCVLHKNDLNVDGASLGYYIDRKTTSTRGKILLKDIAFLKNLDPIPAKTKLPNSPSIDSDHFCYFEIGVNCRRGRVYLFAAKCLSDYKLWFNAIAQAIAWNCFTIRDTLQCGYIHMKYGISSQWVTNYVILSGRQMTVISKDIEEENDSRSADSEDSEKSDSNPYYSTYDVRKVQSISYASVHQIHSCATVQESGQPICITFSNQVLYLQSEYKSHTELWYQTLLKQWSIPRSNRLEDQYLNNDNIPVAIDKCINFISTYGTDTPSVYLQQNIDSPVANSIVDAFRSNAWDIQLKIDLHSVHDISTAFILFLKSLSECVFTEKLYHNWIKANECENRNERLHKFKLLLNLLPVVNYATLKKLVAHLVCIIENNSENQTTILNIAPAICHSFLFLKCGDKIVDDRVSTFDGSSSGIDIITDLILSYGWLFDVTTQELEKERRIQKAMELLKSAKHSGAESGAIEKSVNDCEEFLIGVYVYSKEWGKCLNVRLTPAMTALDLIRYVVKKARIKENIERLAVYEIVYNDQLERILHYSDIVLGVTLAWVQWSQHYCQHNYLCVKQNRLYDQILPHISEQTPITIFSELKYANKSAKSFKKVLVEFIGAKLSLYKDEKSEKCLGQWNIEDIVWYLGAEKKRLTNSANNKLSITFIEKDNPPVKTKETSYFGRTICCNNADEYHKWIAAMLCAEYPNGVVVTIPKQIDLLD